MIDPAVMKVGNIQRIVSPERIRIDDTVRFRFLLDDRQQGLCLGVGYHRRVDLPTILQKPKYGHCTSSTTATFSFADTTEITFVGLDLTMQSIARQLAGEGA